MILHLILFRPKIDAQSLNQSVCIYLRFYTVIRHIFRIEHSKCAITEDASSLAVSTLTFCFIIGNENISDSNNLIFLCAEIKIYYFILIFKLLHLTIFRKFS